MNNTRRCFGIALAWSIAFSVSAASPALLATVLPTPIDSSIPQGAQRVPVLTIRLQATCAADVAVSGLTLGHSGLGAVSDILRVYAFEGSQRRSRGASVPAKSPIVVRLQSVTVPACSATTLTIDADFSSVAQSGGEHRFDLTSVAADGAVTVSHIIQPHTVRTVTPSASQPQVTASFLPVLTDVSYGADRVVARLLLTGGRNADQRVNTITFTNDGSARGADLQNLYLETADHTRVSVTLPQMDGKTATITLSPLLSLMRNEAKLLQLKADVRASRTHTIEWTIDQPSDIQAPAATR